MTNGNNWDRLCFHCMGELSAPGATCPRCGCDNQNRTNGPGCLPATVLNNQYFVGRSLGRGGFGVTYLGYDLNLKRRVAIKEYFPAGLATRSDGGAALSPFTDSSDAFARGQQRALDEGVIIANMGRIPNVVQVYNAFRANGTVYIVMEYIAGATLNQLVSRAPGGRLDWAYAYDLLRPILRALNLVHAKGVIHRDVSPDNIILSRETGDTVLLDFGAAHPYVDARGGHTQSLRPGFAPVEQYSSVSVQDGRTDEYALCATFYYLITGCIPTDAEQIAYTGQRIASPRELGVDIPAGVEAVLMKGMSARMEERYPSMRALERAFDAAIAASEGGQNSGYIKTTVMTESRLPEPPRAPQSSAAAPKRPRRRIGTIALILALVIAAGAGGVLLGRSSRQPPAPSEAPVTEAPATGVPAIELPETKAPATEAPVIELPATEAPVIELPATEAPVTEVPATEIPVTEVPATEVPATEVPATEAPVTEAPVTEAPVTQVPATEVPVTEAPATKVPVTEAPSAKAPAAIPASEWPVLRSDVIDDDQVYNGRETYTDPVAFGSRYLRKSIASVTFANTLAGAPGDAWDVSEAGDGSVLAWAVPDGELYDLTIAGEGGVRAPEDCERMFCGYEALTSLQFNGCFDTSGAKNMSDMFFICCSLDEIEFSGFDTSNVTDMNSLFFGCSGLTALDLSGFDTSNVTNMVQMFAYCDSLAELDLSSFDTSSVTNMSLMFAYCNSLAELDLRSFDTSNVTNMSEMFYDCGALTQLDLTSFDTSSVADMSSMFFCCGSLRDVLAGPGFVIGAGTNTENMFLEASISSIPYPEATPAPAAIPASEWPVLRSDVIYDNQVFNGRATYTDPVAFGSRYLRKSIASVSFANTLAGAPGDAWDVSEAGDGSVLAWVVPDGELYDLTIAGEGGVRAPENCERLFCNYEALTSLQFNGCFDTSGTKNMRDMFFFCYSLGEIDFSGFDTSNVTDMAQMFVGCSGLTALNFSGFDTSNVTQMYEMFAYCNSLTELDLSSFDTSNVDWIFRMFASCESLTELDLSYFDTSNVTDMFGMFESCISLAELDLSSFDTSNVTSMLEMFKDCTALREVRTGPGFVIGKDTDTTDMFDGCAIQSLPAPGGSETAAAVEPASTPAPTAIPVSEWPTMRNGWFSSFFYERDDVASISFKNSLAGAPADAWDVWDASRAGDGSVLAWVAFNGELYDVTVAGEGGVRAPADSSSLFQNFQNATSIHFNGCFDTSSVITMHHMFDGCNRLETLDLSGFDTSNVTDMDHMFSRCSGLTTLDLSGFDTSNVDNMSGMFGYCHSLTLLDLSGFDTSNVGFMSGMFEGCSSLASLDVSDFNTSDVWGMSNMFRNCSSLTSLDVTGFDTSNVTGTGFYEGINNMFSGCENLTSLDLTSFNTSNVRRMEGLFRDCIRLTEIRTGEGFVIGPETETEDMFKNCPVQDIAPSAINTAAAYRQGDKGDGVARLQQALIDAGALSGEADGDFGKKTDAAVREMQKRFGMEPTGIADFPFLQALNDW